MPNGACTLNLLGKARWRVVKGYSVGSRRLSQAIVLTNVLLWVKQAIIASYEAANRFLYAVLILVGEARIGIPNMLPSTLSLLHSTSFCSLRTHSKAALLLLLNESGNHQFYIRSVYHTYIEYSL